jgi:hypothetical protein
VEVRAGAVELLGHPALEAGVRGTADVLRSLKRFVAEGLGDEWEVRLWDEAGSYDYPFARVRPSTPVAYSGPRLWQNALQSFAVHAYLLPTDDLDAALAGTMQLQDELYDLFASNRYPLRVPLFDYDGVGLYETTESRHPYDWVRISDLGTEELVSPEDDRLRWVVCTFRGGWGRTAYRAPAYRVVQNVKLDTEAS